MKKLLWLDDYRNPHEIKDGIKHWLVFSPIEYPYDIVWVKSYKEFTAWINENGLPNAICFDHDLGLYESGYDCAKWLVEYCLDRNLKIPTYNIQSANPVGKSNINGILQSFIKRFH